MSLASRLTTVLAALALAALVGLAVAGPGWTGHDPRALDLDSSLQAPSAAHWFGTDQHGRDVFARVVAGARVSLGVGLLATVVAVVLGGLIGIVAGYAGGWVDLACVALTDVTLAFPSLLLALGIAVVLPPGVVSVLLALALVGWTTFARLLRSQVLTLRESPAFHAARAAGVPAWRLLLRHLLPQCRALVVVAGTVKLGGFILGEASLSFLGFGVAPPAASWGGMISLGRDFIATAPWIVVAPGAAIAVTILACNLLGDRLRDAWDPTLTLRGGGSSL